MTLTTLKELKAKLRNELDKGYSTKESELHHDLDLCNEIIRDLERTAKKEGLFKTLISITTI